MSDYDRKDWQDAGRTWLRSDGVYDFTGFYRKSQENIGSISSAVAEFIETRGEPSTLIIGDTHLYSISEEEFLKEVEDIIRRFNMNVGDFCLLD